jgi:hypothetical protein
MGMAGDDNKGTAAMADDHGEHHHGSMDIRAQEKTFQGFIRMSVWVTVIAIGILVFMALANS